MRELSRRCQQWDLTTDHVITTQVRTRGRLEIYIRADSSGGYESTIEELEKSFLLGASLSLNEPGESIHRKFNLPSYTTVQIKLEILSSIKQGDGDDYICTVKWSDQVITLYAKGGCLRLRKLVSKEKIKGIATVNLYDW